MEDPGSVMRILGHIHTLNDEEIIDVSIDALLRQTHPLAEILVVDNHSTDRTLDRVSARPVTLIRHQDNVGTSGAVVTGMEYAIARQYDWIWIFDADSAPRPDALHTLLSFYASLPEALKRQVWLLSPLHLEAGRKIPPYQMMFTKKGIEPVQGDPQSPCWEFDSTIWSGALYRLDVVQKIGLPSVDYVLDVGEHEYGYRGRRAGYRAFLHRDSILEHNIGNPSGLQFTEYRMGLLRVRMRELPPIRCYYLVRNMLYFWLYAYRPWSLLPLVVTAARVMKLMVNFGVRLAVRRREFEACLRGVRDGLLGRMAQRF
ncbi:glycosyltransferase [Candidatus Nitrospira bockiana]